MRAPHGSLGRCLRSLLVCALFAPACVSASDITFTASTGGGVIYGTARELVFSVYNGQSYTQSELDWELQPLITTNATLTMNGPAGFEASLDVQLGIPWKTGAMSDSDWLNVSYNGDDTKTNYSHHDSYTERAILADARIGWTFRLADWVTVAPFLQFGFMDFKWSARDGYLQYPPNWFSGATKPYPDASTQPKIPVSGTVVIYEQTYYIFALGLDTRFTFGSFGGSVSMAFSPLVFCNDVDNHLNPSLTYQTDYFDTLSNGFLLEPKVRMEWRLQKSSISLSLAYRHIWRLIGDTSVVNAGVGPALGGVVATFDNGAGASYDALGISVGYGWTP